MKTVNADELREKLQYEFSMCKKMPKNIDSIVSYQIGIMFAINILDEMKSLGSEQQQWLEGR